jgi:hypothetical protein
MVDLLVLGFKKQEGILHDQDNGGIGGDQKGGALEILNSRGCREAVSCIFWKSQKNRGRKNLRYAYGF